MLMSLSRAQMQAYRATISGVHGRRTYASVLNRFGTVVRQLDSLEGGQVQVDARSDVTRLCNLTIVDPLRQFGFDADTYSGGILDLSRQIKVVQWVYGPLLAHPIEVDVFTGPVTRLTREGPIVSIEAQGREVYGLTPSRRTLTLRKGMKRTDAIKTILSARMGEDRLGGIPDLKAKLPEDFVVAPKDLPWKRARKLGDSLNRQLFYDGAGRPYLRRPQGDPSWVFNDGEGGNVTSPVVTSADLTRVKNHIRIIGAVPKKKKKPVSGSAVADASHPLSAQSLGTDGAPMWLSEEINNDHLRTDRECEQYAKEILKQRLRLIHETSFNALPTPHLDPLDLVAIRTPYEAVNTRLETFVLPLGLDGDMTVGYVDPYRLRSRGRRNGGKR